MYLGPIGTFKVKGDLQDRFCGSSAALMPIIYYSQPYVPHIGLMYASGIKEADTIFCTVSGHLNLHFVLKMSIGEN